MSRQRTGPVQPTSVEEALLAAPALLAGVTMIAGYVRATAARPRR